MLIASRRQEARPKPGQSDKEFTMKQIVFLLILIVLMLVLITPAY